MLDRDSSLIKGDVVDIIAPASACSQEEYESCLKLLEEFDLKPRFRDYNDLIDKKEIFCSNTIDYRFNHLCEALDTKDSKAIWCVTGGYGSYQLLDGLSKIPAPRKQKLFIGYSDISALSNFFVNKWNWKCIYGPTLVQIARGNVSTKAKNNIKDLVFGEVKTIRTELEPVNKTAKKNNEYVGKLVGGCLSLIQAFIGTPQEIDTKGKIVLLEDDKFETPGRINRIFDHMFRSGMLNEVRAVVLGSFLEEEEENHKNELDKAIEYLSIKLDNKNIPLLRNKNFGHAKDMISLPLGVFTNIKTGDNCYIKIDTGF